MLANEGKMVDASFVAVPKQRNNREENKLVKEGKVPSQWEKSPHKLAQKDTEARWTKKNNVSFYGYKNHVKADTKTKLTRKYAVTAASVYDSQALDDLLDTTRRGAGVLCRQCLHRGRDKRDLRKKESGGKGK